ncbi:MAG: hypothetical protein AAF623_18990, partial [Planctomycetota bacterium]
VISAKSVTSDDSFQIRHTTYLWVEERGDRLASQAETVTALGLVEVPVWSVEVRSLVQLASSGLCST